MLLQTAYLLLPSIASVSSPTQAVRQAALNSGEAVSSPANKANCYTKQAKRSKKLPSWMLTCNAQRPYVNGGPSYDLTRRFIDPLTPSKGNKS